MMSTPIDNMMHSSSSQESSRMQILNSTIESYRTKYRYQDSIIESNRTHDIDKGASAPSVHLESQNRNKIIKTNKEGYKKQNIKLNKSNFKNPQKITYLRLVLIAICLLAGLGDAASDDCLNPEQVAVFLHYAVKNKKSHHLTEWMKSNRLTEDGDVERLEQLCQLIELCYNEQEPLNVNQEEVLIKEQLKKIGYEPDENMLRVINHLNLRVWPKNFPLPGGLKIGENVYNYCALFQEFKEGDSVEAFYPKDGKWYPAKYQGKTKTDRGEEERNHIIIYDDTPKVKVPKLKQHVRRLGTQEVVWFGKFGQVTGPSNTNPSTELMVTFVGQSWSVDAAKIHRNKPKWVTPDKDTMYNNWKITVLQGHNAGKVGIVVDEMWSSWRIRLDDGSRIRFKNCDIPENIKVLADEKTDERRRLATTNFDNRRRRLAATPCDNLSPAEQVIKRFHATQRQNNPHIARLEKLIDEMNSYP